MPTTQQKLDAIRKLRDPNAAITDVLAQLMASVQVMKGEKGEKGDTPIKGKDYFTDVEIQSIVSYIMTLIPVPKDGKDGEPGKKGDRGERGADGKSIVGEKGKDGRDGKDGKSADPVDTKKVVEEAVKKLLSTEEWKGLEKKVLYNKFDQRWHGGGSSTSTGGQLMVENLTAQCDGLTKTFTIPAHSIAVKVEGTQFPIIYAPLTDWTASGTTLTLSDGVGAPETGQTLLFYYVA
jgi:hypothetical protein